MSEEDIAQAHEALIDKMVEQYGPRKLAEMVLDRDSELMEQATTAAMYDDDLPEPTIEAHRALADIRDQILKGDHEWAIELIGREIGY